MKPILDRVTITGADDSVEPKDLKRLQAEFPFVEWGILVSKHKTFREDTPRFPSVGWIEELSGHPDRPHGKELGPESGVRVSVHLCGAWVRQICKNEWKWLLPDESAPMIYLMQMAKRVQLNFHSYIHRIVDREQLATDLTTFLPGKQVICQIDGANDDIVSNLYDDGANVAGLYDRSGGAGVLPDLWAQPLKGIYTGYAGGLAPWNIKVQLEIISEVVTDPIWIDVESHVRSEDGERFDLDRVHDFLERVEPWVVKLACSGCSVRSTCKWAYDCHSAGAVCPALR